MGKPDAGTLSVDNAVTASHAGPADHDRQNGLQKERLYFRT